MRYSRDSAQYGIYHPLATYHQTHYRYCVFEYFSDTHPPTYADYLYWHQD